MKGDKIRIIFSCSAMTSQFVQLHIHSITYEPMFQSIQTFGRCQQIQFGLIPQLLLRSGVWFSIQAMQNLINLHLGSTILMVFNILLVHSLSLINLLEGIDSDLRLIINRKQTNDDDWMKSSSLRNNFADSCITQKN